MLRRRSGFTIIELAIVIGIFLVMIAALTPFVRMVRQHAHAIACAGNLRQISLGLHRFASDNSGAFPQDLGALYPAYVKDEKAFDCPATKNTGAPDKPDYDYVAGLTERSPQDQVIAYDASGNHKDRGRNILRVNGSVEWVRKGEGGPG